MRPRWVGVAVMDEAGNVTTFQMKDPAGSIRIMSRHEVGANIWETLFNHGASSEQIAYIMLRGELAQWEGDRDPSTPIQLESVEVNDERGD